MSMKFTYTVKVYYEDTDAEGVVYYANYLKFLERARTESIYSLGLTNTKLLNDHGIYIVVRSCNINYLKPAKFEDKLTIVSTIESITRTSFVMKQIIKRDNELNSDAEVRLITVNQQGRPSKIPDILESKFKNYLSS